MTDNDQAMPNDNATPYEGNDHPIIARFRQAKITSDNCKFDLTVASLNSDILIEVADIVKNQTAGNAYTQLKARLLKRYSISSDERIHRLMELTLGNLKPTQLLHRMQALAMDNISTQVLKFFWLDRLPPSVRSVISVLDGDLEKLAKKADKYLRCSSFPVMAVTESPTLDKAVAALDDQVSALSNRSTVAEERQQIQMVKSTKSSSDEQCYYHRRFGAQAKKCRLPCSFTKKRPKGAVMAATAAPHIPRRIFITDGVLQLHDTYSVEDTIRWPYFLG
ncbi:uncharacterized protein LOC126882709 [Diabrotica virgifera virgifera]|uniref:DUF7041 domain-containing protein n=2 Tax=Diabrotica virgifera virgifera TaxID=50390 RepID=A0ABM5K0D1_DIAVI|nr:uncharacterized protein LOC126882709 [Diabrotica virgifera virgifera]